MARWIALATVALACIAIATAATDYDKATNAQTTCTKGRLWLSEANTGAIRVLNLDNAMEQVGNFASPVAANVNLYFTETGKSVVAVNRGSVAANYTNGITRFFTPGTSGAAAATPAQHNFNLPCTSPVHFTSTQGWVAVFCDGYYNVDNAYHRNSTANYINEDHLHTTTTDVDDFSWSVPSAHHGVAWAFDEDHFLYSVASQARRNRQSTDSLPMGFVLAFRNGTEVHDLNDIEDTHASCHGFHGEVHVDHRFAFGCDSNVDASHDGILVVTKNEQTETYTSKKLKYPTTVPTARTGTLKSNHHTKYFIGNYGNHLLAFNGEEATAVSNDLLLNVTGQCGWNIDYSYDGFTFWLAPTGWLHISKIQGGTFVKLASVQVFTTPIVCSTVTLVPGFGVAAVLRRDGATSSVSYVNLAGATVTKYDLNFVPQTGAIVAQDEFYCAACPTCKNGKGNVESSGASALATPVVALLGLLAASVAALIQ